jgi:hypothetical protein
MPTGDQSGFALFFPVLLKLGLTNYGRFLSISSFLFFFFNFFLGFLLLGIRLYVDFLACVLKLLSNPWAAFECSGVTRSLSYDNPAGCQFLPLRYLSYNAFCSFFQVPTRVLPNASFSITQVNSI